LVGDGRMFKPEDISRSLLYAIRWALPSKLLSREGR